MNKTSKTTRRVINISVERVSVHDQVYTKLKLAYSVLQAEKVLWLLVL